MMDVWRSGYSAHAPLNAGPEPHDDDLRFNSNLRDLVARDQLVPSARPLPPGWTTSNVTDPQHFCSFRNHVHNYETYVTPTSPAAISFQFPLHPPSRIRNSAAGAVHGPCQRCCSGAKVCRDADCPIDRGEKPSSSSKATGRPCADRRSRHNGKTARTCLHSNQVRSYCAVHTIGQQFDCGRFWSKWFSFPGNSYRF